MIEVTVIGTWGLAAMSGEFDISNSNEIDAAVADLADRTVTELTVDLGSVTFIGADGIRALIAADRRLQGLGGRMVLVGASALTRRVFGLAGVTEALPLVRPPGLFRSLEAGSSPPVGDAELSRLLVDVSRLLLTDTMVTGNLRSVSRAAVEIVPGCTGASIALVARGLPRSAAVSDQIAVAVDLAQYALGEGPCLEAVRLSERIRVDALHSDGRFVRFAPLATRLGVAAVLSLPVVIGQVTVGSLNLYSAAGFGAGAEATAEVIGAQVAAALVQSEIYGATMTLARRVQQRSDDDREVHIAAGVLAGFEECSIDQANRLLRSSALRAGELVTVAARRVLAALQGIPPTVG